jgi:hypothetical protein
MKCELLMFYGEVRTSNTQGFLPKSLDFPGLINLCCWLMFFRAGPPNPEKKRPAPVDIPKFGMGVRGGVSAF